MKRMYSQIKVNPDKRFLQKILWSDNLKLLLQCIELEIVPYDTNCVVYLPALRCLVELEFELYKWYSNSKKNVNSDSEEQYNNFEMSTKDVEKEVLSLSWKPKEGSLFSATILSKVNITSHTKKKCFFCCKIIYAKAMK